MNNCKKLVAKNNELTEIEFKNKLLDNIPYFKKIYINDNDYFQFKADNGKSDKYYIIDSSIIKWANLIADSGMYFPWNNDKKLLIKDLLEKRGKGVKQYSNGTLHSSSRLVTEIFFNYDNRIKFIKWLDLDENYNPEDFKWILEYRLPIFGENDPHPAQMDLVVENDKYFICIESKMKEIYENDYKNDFELRYRDTNNDLLKEFENDFTFERIKFKNNKGQDKEKIRLSLNELENNNFYFKQQICHLLAIREKQKKDPNKKYIFLNFVFDISDIKGLEELNGANKRYKEKEKLISNILAQHFEATNITYKGLLSHKELLHL